MTLKEFREGVPRVCELIVPYGGWREFLKKVRDKDIDTIFVSVGGDVKVKGAFQQFSNEGRTHATSPQSRPVLSGPSPGQYPHPHPSPSPTPTPSSSPTPTPTPLTLLTPTLSIYP